MKFLIGWTDLIIDSGREPDNECYWCFARNGSKVSYCSDTPCARNHDRWNALSAEEKAPYEEESAADKIRYQKEMAAYKSSVEAATEETIEEVFGEDSEEEDAVE